MIDRTVNYVLEDKPFKTLGSGRTDAMVSSTNSYFELFATEPLGEDFLALMNQNLPSDIRVISLEEVDAHFNIIQDVQEKEYYYLFSHGEKVHPFCVSLLTPVLDELNITLMQKGAELFQGTHNFINFCYKPHADIQAERTLVKSEIVVNEEFTANFFPEESYIFKIRGKGFMRYQVRLMMGALIRLGREEFDLAYLEKSLKEPMEKSPGFIAPASGLHVHQTSFKA